MAPVAPVGSGKAIAAHRPSTFGLWGAFMSRPQNFDRNSGAEDGATEAELLGMLEGTRTQAGGCKMLRETK